jgi:hypothetical protein
MFHVEFFYFMAQDATNKSLKIVTMHERSMKSTIKIRDTKKIK